MAKIKKKIDKEFKLSSWAINNKTTIYVLMFLFLYLGISSYFAMPRENFPEISETKIYISSVYPGNTAEDIEKLITTPLEDKLKSVSNVIEITSTSQEDYSIITVEFDENIEVDKAKQKVKDEIDQETAGEDWPTFNGAKVEPNVFELSMSEEIPILNINISGDYPVYKLKEFGEYLQDEIEDLSEIKKVDIRGAQDKEIEVVYHIGSYSDSSLAKQILVLATRAQREENPIPGKDATKLPTLRDIFYSVEFHEREVFEMFGVYFTGHPDNRRLLLPEDWADLPPLRKDFAIKGR